MVKIDYIFCGHTCTLLVVCENEFNELNAWKDYFRIFKYLISLITNSWYQFKTVLEMS